MRFQVPAASLAHTAIYILALTFLVHLNACTTKKTASGDEIKGKQTLELKSGDEIRVITTTRERLALVITEITPDSLEGRTLQWDASRAFEDQVVSLPYDELAFVQLEKSSPGKTAGLVASITILGAMIAAITVGPAPIVY